MEIKPQITTLCAPSALELQPKHNGPLLHLKPPSVLVQSPAPPNTPSKCRQWTPAPVWKSSKSHCTHSTSWACTY